MLVRRGTFSFEIPERIFLKATIIEPYIIVVSVVRKFVFVLDTAFAEDGALESGAYAVLLFEFCICGV